MARMLMFCAIVMITVLANASPQVEKTDQLLLDAYKAEYCGGGGSTFWYVWKASADLIPKGNIAYVTDNGGHWCATIDYSQVYQVPSTFLVSDSEETSCEDCDDLP